MTPGGPPSQTCQSSMPASTPSITSSLTIVYGDSLQRYLVSRIAKQNSSQGEQSAYDSAAQRHPAVTGRNGVADDAHDAEVTLQLLTMSGGIDEFAIGGGGIGNGCRDRFLLTDPETVSCVLHLGRASNTEAGDVGRARGK